MKLEPEEKYSSPDTADVSKSGTDEFDRKNGDYNLLLLVISTAVNVSVLQVLIVLLPQHEKNVMRIS